MATWLILAQRTALMNFEMSLYRTTRSRKKFVARAHLDSSSICTSTHFLSPRILLFHFICWRRREAHHSPDHLLTHHGVHTLIPQRRRYVLCFGRIFFFLIEWGPSSSDKHLKNFFFFFVSFRCFFCLCVSVFLPSLFLPLFLFQLLTLVQSDEDGTSCFCTEDSCPVDGTSTVVSAMVGVNQYSRPASAWIHSIDNFLVQYPSVERLRKWWYQPEEVWWSDSFTNWDGVVTFTFTINTAQSIVPTAAGVTVTQSSLGGSGTLATAVSGIVNKIVVTSVVGQVFDLDSPLVLDAGGPSQVTIPAASLTAVDYFTKTGKSPVIPPVGSVVRCVVVICSIIFFFIFSLLCPLFRCFLRDLTKRLFVLTLVSLSLSLSSFLLLLLLCHYHMSDPQPCVLSVVVVGTPHNARSAVILRRLS